MVIGAGAIGCSSAYYLSKHGFKVVVVEENELASGSSGANPGIVACPIPSDPMARFQQHSRRILLGLSEELDTDVDFRIGGAVYVTVEEEMRQVLREQAAASESSEFPVEFLDADRVRELEPGIAPRVIGSVYDPHRGRINPLKLTRGYMRAAARLGAVLRENTAVQAVKVLDQ